MLLKHQVHRGVKLRTLQQIGRVSPGIVGTVDLVREAKAGWQWGFTVQWQGVRPKERYSTYFGEDALGNFEIAPEGSETLHPVTRRGSKWRPEQLRLPFQDSLTHQGNEALD
jgi:hypothetical protein